MSSTSSDHHQRLAAILREHGHDQPADFLRALAKLFAVYPDRQGHSPERWEAYVEHLADLPLRAMQWACADAIRTSKFLPTPAEIRERVAKAVMVSGGVHGAEQAWSQVMRTIGKHGTATLPPGGFGDLIADAVMTGPVWRQLGQTDTDMLPSERKAFVEAYRARELAMRQSAQRGTLPALPPSTSSPTLALVDGLAAKITSKGVG